MCSDVSGVEHDLEMGKSICWKYGRISEGHGRISEGHVVASVGSFALLTYFLTFLVFL